MLHLLHRLTAIIIGTFILLHLVNHLFIIGGVEKSIFIMDQLRVIYRNVFIEIVLIAGMLFQACSGIYFVWKRKGRRHGFFEKAQVVSGLYLAFFIFNHISAVLFGRLYFGLDTNIYYAIAGFYVSPFQLYFIPYYFLAVVSLFIHIASAFNWLSREKINEASRLKISYLIIAIGFVISLVLTLGFNGVYNKIRIPEKYLTVYK